jgi:hypothetical protein
MSEQVSSSINTIKDTAADRMERAADLISTGADRIQGSVSSSSELNSASDRMRDSAASLGGAISPAGGNLG